MSRNLVLNKETLRRLDQGELLEARGAAPETGFDKTMRDCPSVADIHTCFGCDKSTPCDTIRPHQNAIEY